VIVYLDSAQGITVEQLGGFFVGWFNPPSPETHLQILTSSDHVILALDDETGNVVGFINAITDGVLCAFIPLLEVLPSYQGRGIGTALVRRLLDRLDHLYAVDLMCDPGVQPFYERLGMRRATGMMFRRYDRQSGETETS